MLEDAMCLRFCVSQIQLVLVLGLWVKTAHSGSLFALPFKSKHRLLCRLVSQGPSWRRELITHVEVR